MKHGGSSATALEHFYAATYPRVVGELVVVTGDRSVAEDAVQEAFVRLLTRWDRVSTYDDPVAWVRRVAYNIALDRWRRESRERRKGRRSGHALSESRDSYPSDDPLLAALHLLSPEHRHVMVLRAVHDPDLEQIAAQLGVPIGTVKSRLSRAREALTTVLNESRNHD